MGNKTGAVYAQTRYDDPAASIAAFIDMAEMLFEKFISSDTLSEIEFQMHQLSFVPEERFVYTEGGPLRLVWISCSKCYIPTLN